VRFDLHRHLEGSHSAKALLAVALEHGLKSPIFFNAGASRWKSEAELDAELKLGGPSSPTQFYSCIVKARAAYVSVAAVQALAKAAFLEAAAECDGFEMRISLFSMTRTLLENEGLDWRASKPADFALKASQLLAAVLDARDAAERSTHKPMHVRLGYSRTFESEPHYRALSPILRERKADLSGLDILGIVSGPDREPLPPALLQILDEVRADLPDLTVHAGEFEGHAAVDRTLALSPRAIGHGVRSVESAHTLEALRAAGVTLEVCPMSNHLLIHDELAQLTHAHHGAHPLVTLQRHHVHAVVGSDDPTPMNTTFDAEWKRALELGANEQQLLADVQRRWLELRPRRAL
jgi:adenosine deaminase